MQTVLGVAPCVLLSELNDRGIVASCEIDLCSAINMYSLMLASEQPAACVDWNNNYGDDPDKVILFHCGPIAQSLMEKKGIVTDHKMFAKANPGKLVVPLIHLFSSALTCLLDRCNKANPFSLMLPHA